MVQIPFYVEAGVRILPVLLELIFVYGFKLHEHISGQMTVIDRTCGQTVEGIKIGNVLVGTLTSQLVTIVLLSASADVSAIMILSVTISANFAMLFTGVPGLAGYFGATRRRRILFPVLAFIAVFVLIFYEELVSALIIPA
jgi:hypothetical protein